MSRSWCRVKPADEQILVPVHSACPECGRVMRIRYSNRRAVVSLRGLVRVRLKIRRCETRSCGRYHQAWRPEAEAALALPQQEFGLDVIALAGALRYREHRSVPEIHRELTRRGVAICERSVLLERYDELVAASAGAAAHREALENQSRVILAIDGLQPDVGHEVLWVIRDCLSGLVLLARALLSSASDELAGLLREVAADLAALGVPVGGVVSDGQHSIRLAIARVWPDVPHQLCHFHYLREAALPIFEADRHAKKELKKTVRGVRPIERKVEGRDDEAAQVVLGYCAAVRSALTDDGRPPLKAAGLRLHDRLEAIEASLGRIEEKQPCLFDVGQKLVRDMRVVAKRAAEKAAGGASTLLTRVQHRARGRQGRASRAAARCPVGILDRPCARRLPEARSGRRDGLADRTKGWARIEPSCRRPARCVIEPEAQAGSSFQV